MNWHKELKVLLAMGGLCKTRKTKMKVFNFQTEEHFYICSGKNQQEAQEVLFDTLGEMTFDKIEEVPESRWDKKDITVYEDNDTETEPFFVSIREQMEETPTVICSNDSCLIE